MSEMTARRILNSSEDARSLTRACRGRRARQRKQRRLESGVTQAEAIRHREGGGPAHRHRLLSSVERPWTADEPIAPNIESQRTVGCARDADPFALPDFVRPLTV